MGRVAYFFANGRDRPPDRDRLSPPLALPALSFLPSLTFIRAIPNHATHYELLTGLFGAAACIAGRASRERSFSVVERKKGRQNPWTMNTFLPPPNPAYYDDGDGTLEVERVLTVCKVSNDYRQKQQNGGGDHGAEEREGADRTDREWRGRKTE